MILQQGNAGFRGQDVVCKLESEPEKKTCMDKDDRFILKYIIFQRNEDKRILRFVQSPPTPPSTPSLSLLSPCGGARHTHTRAQTLTCTQSTDRVYFLLYFKKKKQKKTKKKPHMQKSSGTYGAHFCTGGLMLLSSLFVLSIIVLKGEDKAEQCLCAAVS